MYKDGAYPLIGEYCSFYSSVRIVRTVVEKISYFSAIQTQIGDIGFKFRS